jgi:hypothetical protein
MILLNNFKNWKKNRLGGGRISFFATFLSATPPNSFLQAIKEIISGEINNYYVHIDEDNVYPLLEFSGEKYDSIDIMTNVSMPIDMIFLRKDNLAFAKHTMVSIGLTNNFPIEGYKVLEKIILNKNLFLCSFDEPDYLAWQNTKGLSAYKFRGGLIYTKNSLGEKIVDISDRPGRYVFTKYFRYAGSSKMWFGPQIYKYIPQEKLLSFEGAVEIKVIENNITFVNLYESVYDGDEPHNQEVQRRFREHIGIDALKIE